MTTDLMDLGLPKWPQHIVTGAPLSVEQAKEIIRRTDSFFNGSGGNAREWNKTIHRRLKIPEVDHGGCAVDHIRAAYERVDEWRRRWGTISTNYVHNSWISCAFIGGPHGWCHPDGAIGFVDNVGKWPTVKEIYDDWSLLAATFPMIDVGVTLMSEESGSDDSTWPIVRMRVKDGVVKLVEGSGDVHASHPMAHRTTRTSSVTEDALSIAYLPPETREFGIPHAWLDEWEALAATMFPEWTT